MEPIATYEASTLEFRGRAELFADSVRLTGTVCCHGDYDMTIPLTTLQPRITRLRMRGKYFPLGLALMAFGIIGATILAASFTAFSFELLPGKSFCS
jgi:hypothetical protein